MHSLWPALVGVLMGFSSASLGTTGHSDLAAMAALIHRLHIDHPPVAGIPVESIAALKAYVAGLDPHSAYLAPKELARDQDGGPLRAKSIGGWLGHTPEDGLVLVPFHRGPAYQAGIKAPIRLIRVNGQDASRLDVKAFTELVENRRTLHLEGRDLITRTPVKATLVIKPFALPAASLVDIGGQSLLQVHAFPGRQTFNLLRGYLKGRADAGQPAIIDLRYAVGGNLFEALDSVSLVLPRRLPIATRVTSDGVAVPYTSRDDLRAAAGPLYLLIGPHTASAAEVFARALHHYGYAVLVGRTSFGKCQIQQLVRLPAGDGLKLTVGRILDPEGQDCRGQGIAPDLAYSGNPYDTPALLGLIQEHNRGHRLICQAAAYPDGRAWERAIADLGWERRTDGARAISLLDGKGGLRPCLGPPLPLAQARAVLDAERQGLEKRLELVSLFEAGAPRVASPSAGEDGKPEPSHATQAAPPPRAAAPLPSGPSLKDEPDPSPITPAGPGTPPQESLVLSEEAEASPCYSVRIGPFDTARQLLDAQARLLGEYPSEISQLNLDPRLIVEQAHYLELGDFDSIRAATDFCWRIRQGFQCEARAD